MKPKLSRNIFLNANPLGLDFYMQKMMDEIRIKPSFKAPKVALIIGGSSGYGLATRIALAMQGTRTISLAFEKPMDDIKTGSAGFWNQLLFQKYFGKNHLNINADAFSSETKSEIIRYLKENNLSLDCVVYSLASGARPNEFGDLVRSSIKPIGNSYKGLHLDLAKNTLSELTLEKATPDEIKDTVYVMGGSDFKDWMERLNQANVLDNGIKALTYSYIGGNSTKPIYRDGTLGKAKDDLEEATRGIDELLKPLGGEARVALLKAVVTKASLFIPGIAVYGGVLFDVMMNENTHESTVSHIYRLYHDMIYGQNRLEDEKQRILMDTFERNETTQKNVQDITENDDVLSLNGMQAFIDEFYQINGFRLGFDGQDQDLKTIFNTLK